MAYSLSIGDMYTLSSPNNNTFGIQGYETPKIYEDPMKKIKDREQEKIKKGQKPKGKPSKRGHYLEDLKKMTFGPGPSAYDLMKPWVKEDPNKKAKPIKSLTISKNTYIDIIFKDGEKKKAPGPGAYNILQTEEQLKKELQKMKEKPKRKDVRPNFLCDYEYLAQVSPGPGAYNPRLEIKKLHKNILNPDQWIKKHKESSKKSNSPQKFPSVGSYDPIPATIQTFDKIKKEMASKKGTKTKSNYFGGTQRFKDPKMTKSKSYVNFPGPGKYNVLFEWEGKADDKKPKDKMKNLSKIIYKGTDKSIYYED